MITQRDFNKWTNEDQFIANGGFSFELLMHVSKAMPENVLTGLRRETRGRVIAAAEEISNFGNIDKTNLGPIARQHFSEHQSRQQAGSTFDSLPTDNTTRQLIALDVMRTESALESGTSNNIIVKKIGMKINES